MEMLIYYLLIYVALIIVHIVKTQKIVWGYRWEVFFVVEREERLANS